MLVLFETPAGYSLFKVANEKKLKKTEPEDIHETFFSSEKQALKSMELIQFQSFEDTAEAVVAATAIMEGKVTKGLQKFLLKNVADSALHVADKTLAASVKESLTNGKNAAPKILSDAKTAELFRGIRLHMDPLFGDAANGVTASDLKQMQLGLSHSLGRYKLKFSADKVDTMVIQAVGLLDELDKEINTYAMRVKEWYGWHFPELQGLCGDNALYAKIVLKCGFRHDYKESDLSSIIEDETQEASIKEAAEISMGTEVADMDMIHISALAEQVLSMTEYRAQLWDYLRNRMNAIAPNLTILVGELVGARLIAHAGSLLNLAKQPASTVQILGAEKALFRALKTKHDTPKYGLIFHASLVGQAAPKHKGKISRVLAAKTALSIRVDALSDDMTADTTIGYEGRAKVEARLRQLEGGSATAAAATNGHLSARKTTKYDAVAAKTAAAAPTYNDASDMVLEEPSSSKKEKKDKSAKKEKKKRKSDAMDDDEAAAKKAKKEAKKAKKEKKKSIG